MAPTLWVLYFAHRSGVSRLDYPRSNQGCWILHALWVLCFTTGVGASVSLFPSFPVYAHEFQLHSQPTAHGLMPMLEP